MFKYFKLTKPPLLLSPLPVPQERDAQVPKNISMRLLNTKILKLEFFLSDRIPPYAILSHTWEDGEVTFQDIENQTAPTKQGYAKLHDSCRQACLDKLEWIWIDTCCIDKTSSAELSEAINTMFRWYQEAVVCYAFLADVPSDTTLDGRSLFATSRWFTRGWTLQELLAPKRLEFYSREWTHLGTKSGLSQVLREITGVGESYLEGLDLSVASIAARMSWAAKRETTREEDRAYSLLGIFGVHMPLLYGEGGYNAFIRLQEELIRTTDDQSIFAWHASSYDRTGPENWHSFSMLELPEVFAFWLANSPAWFLHCGDIVTCNSLNRTCPFVTTNAGIRIELSIVYDYEINPLYKDQKDFMVLQPYAWLNCRKSTDYWNIMAVPVTIQGDKCVRTDVTARYFSRDWASRRSFSRTLYLQPGTMFPDPVKYTSAGKPLLKDDYYGEQPLILRSLPPGYCIDSVQPMAAWEAWSATSGRLNSSPTGMMWTVFHIIADGSLDVPLRHFYILVKDQRHYYEGGLSRQFLLLEAGEMRKLQLDDPEAEIAHSWSFFSPTRSWRPSEWLWSRRFALYLRLHVDQSLTYDVEIMEVILDDSNLRFLKASLSLCGNLSARLNPNSKAPSLHVPHGKLILIFFIILRTHTTIVEFSIVVILILGVLRWHLRSSRIFLVYIGRFILSQLLTEYCLDAVEPHLPNAQISKGFFLVFALMLILLREMDSIRKNMWLTHTYWPWMFRLTFSATNADDLDESSENKRIIDPDMEVRRSNSDASVKTPNDPRMWRRRMRVPRWV